MKFLAKTFILTATLAGVAYGGACWLTQQRTQTLSNPTQALDDALLKRGEYVAQTADCMACHTVPGEPAFSGGLAMQTPVGAIYSTNITPDKDTGIGRYSYADFVNAVQHGIRADGSELYPAMPYPSYVIMPSEDMQALYAYFMQAVKPVQQQNAESTIPPVVNWRWPLAYWQYLFAPLRQFEPLANANAQINRGKYLVEGPGHCGACHTPRGIAYQENSLFNDASASFLSGAVIDGWRAKSLRGEARGLASWQVSEIVEFLKTGRTDRSAVFGAMADVVEHSTQHFTDADLKAMASYLKTLSPTPFKETILVAKPDTTTAKLKQGVLDSPGAVLYYEYCMVCHRADGQGLRRIFPALSGNSAVYSTHAQSIIQLTLEGGAMPHTPADVMAFAMPGFSFMSDQDIATVINYIRNSWGNQAPEISVIDVSEMRHFLKTKARNITPTSTGE